MLVRLKERRIDGLDRYYHKDKAEYREGDGYTVWSIAEWRGSFGNGVQQWSPDKKAALDSEGRHWEFFGYTIPLYDE